MNAIARVVATEDGFIRNVQFRFFLPEIKILIIISLLLISALGVLYVKDLNRRLYITYNKLQNKSEQLLTEGNKLLLEQSALCSQARIQLIAQRELQMKMPMSTDVMMVKI